jgi:EAL domain-containing protein (putative c-di-GMP-specific phosphodiesterase class I)
VQSGPSGAKHARGTATALASLLAPEAVDAHAIGFSTDDALRAIRTHLGMDVAFVSEFTGGRRVFRRVDAAPGRCPVREGEAGPLEDSYCQRVVDGRLPELIHDAAEVPAAAELPVTSALPVGAHLSVPIRLADGRVYGTFCCFSAQPDHTLTDRDLAMMRIFADLTGAHIDRTLQEERRTDEAEARIRGVLGGDGMSMVFQPIVDIDRGRVVGFEALARFDGEPSRGPDAWFAEAAAVGLGVDLELAAVELALRALGELPDDVYVGVNVSPATVLSGRLCAVLAGVPQRRVVLELTEHDAIEAYDELVVELGRLNSRGVRTAVDDAGAGYATFRHILRLRPDVIKLDMALTRDVDTDANRRALASALIAFGRETGSAIVAEGVETAGELRTLRALGVTTAQGYHLGRPSTLPALHDVQAATRS